jgi:hypothetical protein
MFDPERDDPKGDGAFWRRAGLVALVTALAAFAMWPSISGFEAGPDSTRACVALRDGWHVDRTVSESQLNSSAADPDAVNAFMEWRDGSGACIPEARHRLLVSGMGLGLLLGAVVLAAVVAYRRRTRSGRPEGRPEIAVSVSA